MSRPRLTAALNWPNYERAVLDVFAEALVRLAHEPTLEQGEEPINLRVYWKARQVHLEYLHAKRSFPFVIEFDSTNQPEPDDQADSRRLKKRPDFACALTDAQATDFTRSQIRYLLECKRLGQAEGAWVLTKNYSEHGVLRFRKTEHSYAKGCSSAAMIGYVQTLSNDDVLRQVNDHATVHAIPSLCKAATAWAAKAVTRLTQEPVTREFAEDPIVLRHLWVDLHHVVFVRPPPKTRQRRARTSRRTAVGTRDLTIPAGADATDRTPDQNTKSLPESV